MLLPQVSLGDGALQLKARDASQLFGGAQGTTLEFVAPATETAHFMLIELAATETPEL
jgi:hypothetical protein